MKSYPYRYIKARSLLDGNQKKSWYRFLGPVFVTMGSVVLANVIWPILQYQLFISPTLSYTQLVSPVTNNIPVMVSIDSKTPNLVAASVNATGTDFTKLSNWFNTGVTQSLVEKPQSYIINIPSLKVKNAMVVIGGDDLNEHLIQFGGTALPGQLGSPVIFGHSILRQFYDPREENVNRYISIFSKIMTLKKGERIFIDYDGIRYTYEVKDKVEVSPEDLFILEQRYSNRELKLVTCVPEGTYLRRGVVVASLVDLE